jgi:AraC family transcriptional regulator
MSSPTYITPANVGQWKGVLLEETIYLPPAELLQPQVKEHRIAVNIGDPVYCEYKTGNKWVPIVYPEGSFAIIPNGQGNQIRWFQKMNNIIITLDHKYTNELFEENNLELAEKRAATDETVWQIAKAFKDELTNPGYGGPVYGDSLAIALAIHIGSKYRKNKKVIYSPRGKLPAVRLRSIIEYIHLHIGDNIGIEELSVQACLSPFHFCRIFKTTTGLAPHQYILRLKIDRAIHLIRHKKSSLRDIAYKLGFTDPAHFSNSFKKVTGFTPAQLK